MPQSLARWRYTVVLAPGPPWAQSQVLGLNCHRHRSARCEIQNAYLSAERIDAKEAGPFRKARFMIKRAWKITETKKLAEKDQQASAAAAIKSEAVALSELAVENNSCWEQVLAETNGNER